MQRNALHASVSLCIDAVDPPRPRLLKLMQESRDYSVKPPAVPPQKLPLREVRIGENTLQVYQNGYDLYDAMLAAIDAAQESIYLETYIWKADPIGQVFKEHLIGKAAQGVDVYVISDGFANTVVPHDFKAFPSAIHVLPYQGLSRPWHLLDPRRYALDHRKQLIVDCKLRFRFGSVSLYVRS